MPIRAPAITFLLVAIAYALGLCPSLYWLDSGELAGASFTLGVAHAPGQPLAMLLGKLFCFVPLGDVATRVGLAQVFCGAGAAAIVAWLGARIAARFVDAPRAQEGLGAAAGLLYGGAYAAAFQAIRPEVYALSALLVLGTLACCVRFTEDRAPRWLGLAGLLFGLGLTNHHYLTLLGAAPPAIALLVGKPDAALRRGLGLGAVGTAGALLLYLYLPLRAAHDPLFDWGHATSPSAFLWTVSARAFHKSASIENGRHLPVLLGALLAELTPAAPLCALGGLYLALRAAPRLALALLLAIGGPVVARLLVPFDPGNPDAFGYLSTGIAALALSCVPLLAAIAQALPSAARGVAVALVALAVLVRGALLVPGYTLARFSDTRAIFTQVLADAPAEAIVVPAYFQTTFAIDYLRAVEGARPDLVYVARHTLDHPGRAAALVRRDRRVASLLADARLDAAALASRPGPMLVEYDLDLDARLVRRARVIDSGGRDEELQSRRFALWEAYLKLHQLCRLGAPPRELAQQDAIVRRRIGPDGDTGLLDELRGQCGALRDR